MEHNEPRSKALTLLFLCALAIPSMAYWTALGYLAWLFGGWLASVLAGIFIALVVTFILAVARVSGRCSRLEEASLSSPDKKTPPTRPSA